MFTQFVKKFVGLSTVDQWLLIILGISLALKLLRDIVIYFLVRYLDHNKGNGKCIFLRDNGNTGKCENLFYSKAHFKNHGDICKSKKCPGYRTTGIKVEEIIQTHMFFSLLSIFADWGIRLPSVLLIIRTLLEVKVQ